MAKNYDSRKDTQKHINRMEELLKAAANELLQRAHAHDQSKLSDLEKPFFDKFTPPLAGSTYGSEEYKKFLVDLKPALKHHYANNPHHPEHYKNGVDGMNLFDLMEMYLDWKSASERHANGSLSESIKHNKDRFDLSPQLVKILENTAEYLGWTEE